MHTHTDAAARGGRRDPGEQQRHVPSDRTQSSTKPEERDPGAELHARGVWVQLTAAAAEATPVQAPGRASQRRAASNGPPRRLLGERAPPPHPGACAQAQTAEPRRGGVGGG